MKVVRGLEQKRLVFSAKKQESRETLLWPPST